MSTAAPSLSFGGAPLNATSWCWGRWSCEQLLAGARGGGGWDPSGDGAADLPPETQFVLVELEEGAASRCCCRWWTATRVHAARGGEGGGDDDDDEQRQRQ